MKKSIYEDPERQERVKELFKTYDPKSEKLQRDRLLKASQRDRHLKAKYGIDTNDYNKMFVDQGGCCAICGTHQSNQTKAMAVDHCHHSGRVRGLLCVKCNLGIGNLNDDPELLIIAVDYLKKDSL